MKIVTNNQWRNMLYVDDIPQNVLDDYDHLSGDQSFDGWIKYRNSYYHITDFIRFDVSHPLYEQWSGYVGETYFSSVIAVFSTNDNTYKIGRILS